MAEFAPVLLAEDDEHDVFFMRRAFAKAEVPNPLVSVPDGEQAISYLQGQGEFGDRAKHPEPQLLLLDLKMPLVNGFEVLAWINQQPHLRNMIPVLVLSSSAQEGDVQKAFDLGAHEYLVKPGDFNSLVGLVEDIKRRWLQPTQPPQKPAQINLPPST
ncbi:MAG TPA: response regulator [Clostridia bacterium]|nr:response regulator [Clostridia bacterium]